MADKRGKVPTAELTRELTRELSHYDLNTELYRSDIARACVKAELADRSKVNPFPEEDGELQVELFCEEEFQRGVIRLGDHHVIKMSDATSGDWIARHIHQQRAAQDAQVASMRTSMFLQTPPGRLILSDPHITTTDAMRQLRLWPNDVEAQPDEDSEPDQVED